MFVTSVLPPVNSLYHRKCLGQLQTVLRNGERFAFSFWTLIFLIFSSGWFWPQTRNKWKQGNCHQYRKYIDFMCSNDVSQ